MRSFWSDPYLWIHLAGLAAVPLCLELCLIGFSVGDPWLPVWLELLLVGAIGIAPILWMQWQRPFYIFSLVAISLRPGQLSDNQRRLLTLFKSQRNQLFAAVVPVLLAIALYQIYLFAPAVVLFPPGFRLLGLLLAAVGFLASNLFTQVPLSVASVMLHSEQTFASTNPYPVDQIQQDFSVYGLQVNKILPAILLDAELQPTTPGRTEAAAMHLGAEQKASGTDSSTSASVAPDDDVWG